MSSLADKPISAVATVDGYTQYGMTLLEHYSGLAMQGLLAGRPHPANKATIDQTLCNSYAEFSVLAARTLISELEKQTP